MAASEAAIHKAMIRHVRKRGGWARKMHGGKFASGLLDLHVCYRGHFIAIEVKMPGKEKNLSAIQAGAMAQIKAAGGISRMYVSTVQLDRLLDSIDRLYERRNARGK